MFYLFNQIPTQQEKTIEVSQHKPGESTTLGYDNITEK